MLEKLNLSEKIVSKIKGGADMLLYLGAIVNPIVALPQAYLIFSNKSSTNVSLETWILYFFGALCLLIYGIAHRQMPIIYMNITVLPVYVLIIIGILMYR